MTREPSEWTPLGKYNEGKGRRLILPESILEPALENSQVGEYGPEDRLMVRRFWMKSKEKRAKIVVEIAKESDIKRWNQPHKKRGG